MQAVKKYCLVPFEDGQTTMTQNNDAFLKLGLCLARVGAYNENLQLVDGKKRISMIPLLKYAAGMGGSSEGRDLLLKYLCIAGIDSKFIIDKDLHNEYIKIKDKGPIPMETSTRSVRWTKII